MSDPNPNPAPNPSGTPEWHAGFAGTDTTMLEGIKSFQTPGDFYKSWNETSTELKTLKEKPSTWPDDWREKYSGTDDKKLGVLKRYASPSDALNALFAAQQRISSGDLKSKLPDNATAEQIAAYRVENGIPEKPEGYLEKLPNGLVIGDEDKPIFESFAKALHGINAPPSVAHAAIKWYEEFQENQAAEIGEADTVSRTQAEDKLRADWGADYRANINHINAFLAKAPPVVSEALQNARTPEGLAIFNIPEVMQWFAQTARELDPIGTIVPAGNGAPAANLEAEIADIEKFMRTNRAEYNRDEKKQARLRELYGAREKLKARSAA